MELPEHFENALYFCTDTMELYKGDDSYSAGLRTIESYGALPEHNAAADGVVYLCLDSGNGYILNETRDGYIQVIHGVDNESVEINADGLIAVKAVSLSQVTGLDDEITQIKALIQVNKSPIASADTAGVIKIGEEFDISDDGTVSLKAIPFNKVTGLEDRLNSIEKEIADSVTATDASQIKFNGESLDKVLNEIYTSVVWNDMDV